MPTFTSNYSIPKPVPGADADSWGAALNSGMDIIDTQLAGRVTTASLATGVAAFLATPTSANFAAALTDETGTGANVFATSPTLVTPILGTPTSGTLTNCTGLPISTGVSGLGSNVATFLATPSSANLAAAVTDETGSGALVFGTSPTIATPTITTSATVPLVVGGTGTTSTLTLRSTSGVGTTGADIIFQAGNNGATEVMRLQNGGNVGIGTPSPDALLTVNTIASFGDGAQTTPSIAHKGDLNTGFWFPAADNIAVSVGGIENFRFDSAGRFQAGGTTGLERINVVGSYQGYGWHNTGAGTNEKYWRLQVHDANRSLMLLALNDAYNAAAAPLEIVRNAGTYTTQYVRIAQDGGNVGIGTPSPAYQLQLSSDSAAKPTTNTWTIASDARLKTVLGDYEKGLDAICALRPVRYEYNGLGGMVADGKEHISIVAQEAQEVFPECIGTFQGKLHGDDEEETELLNYNGHAVTFALINAIKELKAKIDILKARN